MYTIQIKLSHIDFWTENYETMELKHKKKVYPYRVIVTVTMVQESSRFILPIKFRGCSADSQLDRELTFPLLAESSMSSSNSDIQSHSIMILRKLLQVDLQAFCKQNFYHMCPPSSLYDLQAGIFALLVKF